MFDGYDDKRVLEMTEIEQRWFDNVKKAFNYSDQSYNSEYPEDHCLEELFKAIDTAKTLRRSLRGEDVSASENKKRFIDFLALEIPDAHTDSQKIQLKLRNGEIKGFTLGEIIYSIRCMIHENENLNFTEQNDYHIQLDWKNQYTTTIAITKDGTFICSGNFLRDRLRMVISKFITGLESSITFLTEHHFNITVMAPENSIKPIRKKRD